MTKRGAGQDHSDSVRQHSIIDGLDVSYLLSDAFRSSHAARFDYSGDEGRVSTWNPWALRAPNITNRYAIV